ncbi:hypothetical protein SEA_JUMBO_98 [Gordonia phage Jumbo]|uniref:Uncharacterized protein n=1 Tax=Gordonia phage Jumbo TaxID=1887650 RepID=A0A1B3B0R5_9CAUD|nr:hypothetical protein BIZ69_gp098 [Gordonia phage Jumbo]AOE44605.1 hypothetical protein SEA_JUMBO_98 [Gordonia phage Jumbo]
MHTLALILAAILAPVAPTAAPEIVPVWSHCDFSQPVRLSGTGTLSEDESPYQGACNGTLISFSGDGVAVYSDGTQTDGYRWSLTQRKYAP